MDRSEGSGMEMKCWSGKDWSGREAWGRDMKGDEMLQRSGLDA